MTLKRLSLVVVVAVVLLAGCKKHNQFSISGKISHAEGDTIYLEELHVSSRQPVAKTKINRHGEFEFKGITSIPSFYLLKLTDNNFITLLVDSAEQVTVEADVANFGKEYNINGSLGSMQIKILNEKLNDTEHKLDSLRSLNNLYKGNPDYEQMRAQWNIEFERIMDEQARFSNDFIMANPFSMASVFALYQKYKDQSYVVKDLQAMKTAASALNSIYPNSEYVKALYENALQFVREEKAAKLRNFIQEQGENSPDIVLPNREGKEIALSSLRGKAVLLQFWAAEDRGSRILNPLLVEVYKKYKNKGLEIYQVNVGNNRSEWIDAIDADNLTWTNVGDMAGSVKATQVYNVQSVPYNYLLDKDGAIVAKNLKGPELDKALARLLNN